MNRQTLIDLLTPLVRGVLAQRAEGSEGQAIEAGLRWDPADDWLLLSLRKAGEVEPEREVALLSGAEIDDGTWRIHFTPRLFEALGVTPAQPTETSPPSITKL